VLLKVENASVQYHKVAALKEISMAVPEGGIVTIIGANGAGKSTTLRAISGLVKLGAGEIWFADRRIDGVAPEKIVAAGIAHVPEGRRMTCRFGKTSSRAPFCAPTRPASPATWTWSWITFRS
jgi:branched-chain amino acid transport system ATP-binding protein